MFSIFLQVWEELNSSFRFRYLTAAFAATAVAQLFFGTHLTLWFLCSVAGFWISWITNPDKLSGYYKLAVLYILTAIGIVFFTELNLLATVLVSLAAPILWSKVVFDTILHARNKNVDAVIILFNSAHIVVIAYFLLSVAF